MRRYRVPDLPWAGTRSFLLIFEKLKQSVGFCLVFQDTVVDHFGDLELHVEFELKSVIRLISHATGAVAALRLTAGLSRRIQRRIKGRFVLVLRMKAHARSVRAEQWFALHPIFRQ